MENSTNIATLESGQSQQLLVPSTPLSRRRLTRKISYTPANYKDEDEYIGFATLPDQVHRKAVRRGFDFTLMVVGESGLGKSTLINSLFLTELYKDRKIPSVEELVHRTVAIEKKQLEIEEKGVRVKLTIVDTPGFNDAVNAEESWKSVVDYVDQQFQQYYQDETGLNRRNIVDNRVHCCLYFISPYGHGLKPADITMMKKLHHKVNIVPLIAKADMLTKVEVKRLKQRVIDEIDNNDIHIYEFPDCDSDEDDDFKQQDKELKAAVPFAVVGCNTVVEAGGKKIRGRAYPWGIVEIDNPNHCDFVRLRQMLISTHMQDLKDVTADVHYENFRAQHIFESMAGQQKERSKLKRDSKPNFDTIVDTDRLLEQKDAEIQRMQAMLAKMQEQLGKQAAQVNGNV
ncbi:septin-2-like isoform X1 [Pomacea canaliculata]|uniref:septin-2-like isoform X1 n=1 Tax=Pomacea canaliculata TaxID=400727 RepID=UPI000D73CF97|nr:septin-2-like isoform X1 [Pomacea canaliculata]